MLLAGIGLLGLGRTSQELNERPSSIYSAWDSVLSLRIESSAELIRLTETPTRLATDSGE